MNIFAKLLVLWIWLFSAVFASSASFAYDFQYRANEHCDATIEVNSGCGLA